MPRIVSRLRRRPGRRSLFTFSAVVAVVLGVLVFASPYYVDGTSMSSTLQPGELLLVDRATTIQRGEVVLFHPPITSPSPLFIKRVIGLPGETVSIHDGHVYIDGSLLNEPYLPANEVTTTDTPDYSTVVPAGTVFVLGDNRTGAWDSRGFGPVPIGSIVGRAWIAIGWMGSSIAL